MNALKSLMHGELLSGLEIVVFPAGRDARNPKISVPTVLLQFRARQGCANCKSSLLIRGLKNGSVTPSPEMAHRTKAPPPDSEAP